MNAVAVIDGEHYADVVRAAFAELPYEFVAAVLVAVGVLAAWHPAHRAARLDAVRALREG